MRVVTCLLMSLGLLAPALGQEQNLFQQYEAATAIFSVGNGDPAVVMRDWPAILLDGLDGDWFQIDSIIPVSNDTALFRKICAQAYYRVKSRGSLAFEMTRFPNTDTPLTTIYASRGGNAFGTHTDPEVLRMVFDLDDPDMKPGTAASTLALYNGTATMHRPSPDLMVIQTDYGLPSLFGRCPQ
jgi:hypothetical protein